MPIPAQRIIIPTTDPQLRPLRRRRRSAGPDRSADAVLRPLPAARRRRTTSATATGLEGVLHEIFPIESYDKKISLEYIQYELGKPRYDPDECRQLRLTYGRPFRVWLRLRKDGTAVEEEVYLGDMPIMIGGGEFIINGAERVVVSQLHRSPGVDFVVDDAKPTRTCTRCRIIPERGSWIEINVTKKDTLGVRIDQSRQVLGHDAAARDGPGVLHRPPTSSASSTRSRRSS